MLSWLRCGNHEYSPLVSWKRDESCFEGMGAPMRVASSRSGPKRPCSSHEDGDHGLGVRWLGCGALFIALGSAALAAQTPQPCAGDDCQNLRNHVTAAVTQIEGEKGRFVSSVRQLIQAITGTYGDEGPLIAAGVEEMARALVGWDQAIRAYRAVLSDAVEPQDAHVALAGVYLERGKGAEGLKEAVAASGLDPWRADAHILQALAYDLAGRPVDAARALAKASMLSVGNPAATYGLAERLIAIGDEAGATAALSRFRTAQEKNVRPDGSARASSAPFVRVGLLRQSAGVAPVFPPAVYARGLALLAEGAYEKGVAELRSAAARDPLGAYDPKHDEEARQGAMALRRADLPAALSHFKAAVEQSPDRADARRMLGVAYQANEEYAQSLEQLNAAVALNATDDRSRRALADVFDLTGRPQDAERVLRATVEAFPVSGGAHYQLGLAYQSTGRNTDAIRELEQAAALSPVIGQDHLYDTIGVLYTTDANLDGALAAYRHRVQVNPNNSDAHRKLGQVYLEQGRQGEAAAEFVAALLLDPLNAEAHAGEAQVHLRLSEYSDAERSARRALTLRNTHATAKYTLGASLIRLGRTEEGTRELEQFQRWQADALVQANRGWELKLIEQAAQSKIRLGDFDAAALLLQQAVSFQPDVASHYVSLGLVLERAGRPVPAIDAFRRALDLHAGPEVHRYLAEAYRVLGQDQESQAEQARYDRAKADRFRERGLGR
ncbi:MAG: tetratricopeptide repeat protein [Acidobacteriota bacterium]